MTRWLGLALVLAAAGLQAQEPPKYFSRYGIEFNLVNYPQKTPQEAIKSVVKAIDNTRYDYFLAQLVEPTFVDARVAEYHTLLYPKDILQSEDDDIAREVDPKTKKIKIFEKERRDKARIVVAFSRLITETRKHFDEDPVLFKELRLMARDGEWETDDEKAIGTLKKITTRKVYMKKREDRWFMEERQN